jgi:hypothetical protein
MALAVLGKRSMSKLELIDTVLLESVNGAGAWDVVDGAASMIPGNHDWKEQSCAARGSWVGTAYGLSTGLVGAAALKKLGPFGQWAVGAASAIGGTKMYASYVNHCEAQKSGAKK